MCVCWRPDLHAVLVVSLFVLSEGPFTRSSSVCSCSLLASILLPLLCPQEEEDTDTKLVL